MAERSTSLFWRTISAKDGATDGQSEMCGLPIDSNGSRVARHRSLPVIPDGWCAIWENEDGELAN
jgi:hypothetical protein